MVILIQFSYTMKKVVGIPFYDKQIAEENKRVKNLAPNSFWCDGNVKDDNLYWSSSVDKLPGVQGAKKRLLEEGGFTTLEDLRDINQPQKKQKLLGLKGIGKKTIDNFAIAITSVVGDKPAETPVEGTDHRKSEFPYIYTESERMFKGTDFEDSWYFYHDALSVMTSASTIEWMKEMGYYERWFLPKLNILHGTIYHSSIPGDSPELMPLDNSLNNDYDQSALRHVAVTLDCQWNKLVKDMRKFSLCTPEEGMLFMNVHFNYT